MYLLRNGIKFKLVALSFAVSLSGCAKGPLGWWQGLNKKAADLAHLESRYNALQAEHEHLKVRYLKLEAEMAESKAKAESEHRGQESLQLTGSKTGRSLASIEYKVPKGLSPEELQTLAYEHFREGRFSESAVSFEELLTRPETASLQDASAMYSAGVSWFQVGNFKKAREHLEGARAHATGEQKDKIQKKVDLWLRVIDKKSEPKNVRAIASHLDELPSEAKKTEHDAHH